MIFVTVGSSGKFEPLIRYMDELSQRLPEEVIIQIGKSDYIPLHCKYFRFEKDLSAYFAQADLVIAHGGAGTCFEVLKLGKKLIGVENKNVNDAHQWDLLNKLENDGNIIWCKNIFGLENEINKCMKHTFVPYRYPECHIHDTIINLFKP